VGTGVLLGSLTLILDILLVSPLTLMYVGDWPMHFSTLVMLAALSLNFLLPQIALGRPLSRVAGEALGAVGITIAFRLALLLPLLGLLVLLLNLAPGLLAEMLNQAISSVAHYAGYLEGLAPAEMASFVTQASILNLAQVVLIFASIAAASLGVAILLRRLFTWYGLDPYVRRLMWVAYGVVVGITLFLGGTVLTLLTDLLLRPTGALRMSSIIVELLSLVIGGAGLAWFLKADQKYGRRCPQCSCDVPGWFQLGKRCPHCGQLLLPGLLVSYES
jgi:hypothetical protein